MNPSIQHIFMSLLLSAGETAILYWLCNSFLHLRKSSELWLLVGFGAYFLFQLVTYWYDFPLFSAWLYYCVFVMLVCYFLYTDSLQIKIFVSSLFVVLNYSCKLIAAVPLMWLQNKDIPSIPAQFIQDPLSQVLSCIIFFFCILLFMKFRSMRKKNKTTLYTIINYISPSGILITSIHLFQVREMVFLFYSFVAVILFCTALSLFYLVDKTEIIDEESEKNEIAGQLLNLQTEYYKNLEQSQNDLKAIRHDLKNHLHVIVSLLKMDQQQQALQYIEEIYSSASQAKIPIDSGNSMVNILLSKINRQAVKQDIALNTHIMIPPVLPIDNVDICIILGNLLDNALEACNRITDPEAKRFVQVEMLFKKAFLFISISNAYNGEYHLANNRYQSVKTGERFCGIGLSNVSTVLLKYGGDMKISHDEKVFTVSVMLSLERGGEKGGNECHNDEESREILT